MALLLAIKFVLAFVFDSIYALTIYEFKSVVGNEIDMGKHNEGVRSEGKGISGCRRDNAI